MTEGHDPYAPPGARLEDKRGPGSMVKAVLVGLGVDIGGSLVTGIVLGMAYAAILAASGASPAEIETSFANISPLSPVSVLGSLIGCGLSVWGGYLCARIARRREYALGAVVAVISTAASLLTASHYPIGVNLALSIATFGSVMFGVRFGNAKNNAT
jgi:hypothetical protein